MLKSDVLSDDAENFVFPAVRKNEMYFYYKGGCLYRFKNGAFRRDKRFELYTAARKILRLTKESKSRRKTNLPKSRAETRNGCV